MTVSAIDFAVLTYTLGLYAAIVISPGPNFALVSRLALQGRKETCRGAILGLAIAATFYAVLAMIGLATLLNEIGWIARTVQIAGGLYLIFLGINGWRESDQGHGPNSNGVSQAGKSFVEGVRLGTIVNLSNPKAIAFFVGLYAVAVPLDASLETRIAVLVGGAALELSWYGLVSGILSRGPFRRFYQAGAKWIERVLGTVLIFFGARLVLNR
ncbi:LysE family transporter [uncultured Litoreibacter sp.]|uniref:LysE family transporter n=1 Tax=uncultured Litoreibacter sp. TaxID=1392394 RepID=UPI002614E0DE|nr:LysE family transporter [uncultured Litoreibacter sp.]